MSKKLTIRNESKLHDVLDNKLPTPSLFSIIDIPNDTYGWGMQFGNVVWEAYIYRDMDRDDLVLMKIEGRSISGISTTYDKRQFHIPLSYIRTPDEFSRVLITLITNPEHVPVIGLGPKRGEPIIAGYETLIR
jgi:hypothetical protein